MDPLLHLEELCFLPQQSVNIDAIYSDDPDQCMKAIICLKNNVIGSNKQKAAFIGLGVIPRLLQLLMDETTKEPLKYETVAIICSLSKGTEAHLKTVTGVGTVPVLINLIIQPQSSPRLVEISLRALRSMFTSSFAPIDLIYETKTYRTSLVSYLLNLASSSRNWCIQECIANILANSCQTSEHQSTLCNHGAVQSIANLMQSSAYKVILPALYFLAHICYQNETVSKVAVTTQANGKTIPQRLVELMSQDNTIIMQLCSAKCMTYLYRANAVDAEDDMIRYKTLPTLARMCKKDKPPYIRATAANTIAYLTEEDTDLQKIASIVDHLIPTLADYFHPLNDQMTNIKEEYSALCDPMTDRRQEDNNLTISKMMKEAAFKALASLAANEENIRKRIIDTKNMMGHITEGLSDSKKRVQKAALTCLHSLSRSVQQLRTIFSDHAIWFPLKAHLSTAPDDVMILVSSTLCNLLLEFSPSKEHFLDKGAVEILCSLTQRQEPALRLNGVWALMNMAFQADQNIKMQILHFLGTNQIFRLLSDSDPNIILKTLGLIRNLLSTRYHIDHIMISHGKQLMHAVSMILDEDHSVDIKEQALCILANIASGTTAKESIMSNEHILKKLVSFMIHDNVILQIASVYCISNLVWNEDEGASQRQEKLIELKVKSHLEEMLHSDDMTLFDKVKTALDQFSHK